MHGDYGFNDLKLKFIHNETDIAFGRVRFHKDLVEPHHIENPIGGGEFKFSRQEKTLRLFGASHDFGKYDIELVKKIIENLEDDDYIGFRNIKDYTITYE